MSGIYNGPIRGGTRGGRDQFKWEDVKNDSQREHYLGHSVKAAKGRWQQGRDIHWYTKSKHATAEGGQSGRSGSLDPELLAEERRLFKLQEEELRLQALGITKKPRTHAEADLQAVLQAAKAHKASEDTEAGRKARRRALKRQLRTEKALLKAKKKKKKTKTKKKTKKHKHKHKSNKRKKKRNRHSSSSSSSSSDSASDGESDIHNSSGSNSEQQRPLQTSTRKRKHSQLSRDTSTVP